MRPATAQSSTPSQPGMAGRLMELLRGGGATTPGRRVTLLSLDPARKHFGADWPRLSPKVHAIIATQLRAGLAGGDVHCPLDDLSYLLLPAPRNAGEWEKLVENLAGEIGAKLFGRGQGGNLLAVLHLDTAAEEARAPARGGAQAAKEPEPGATATTNAGSAIERMLQVAETGTHGHSLEGIGCSLLPVLALEGLAPAWWTCRPGNGLGGVSGYGVLPADADPLLFAELDAMMAEAAVSALRSGALGGGALGGGALGGGAVGERARLIQLPVHRATLSLKKHRETYLRICRGVLASHREQVLFDVSGIDEGTPTTRVAEYIQWLRPFARAIAVTIPVDFAQLSVFAGTNAISIGTDLAGLDPEMASSRLGRFVSRVKAAGPRCHVLGVENRAQADLCLKLGVDYLAGPLVAEGFC